MKFRTEVPAPSSTAKITYNSSLLFLGSCFSLNIHNQLQNLKFNSLSNPFGIVYNPSSISKQISRICQAKEYQESDLHFYNERWFSFDHHSDFSFASKSDCLKAINQSLNQAHQQLKQSNIVFLTLGTAWTYHHNDLKITVSNCHKIPSKTFCKELTSVTDMVSDLNHSIQQIRKINPRIQIVFSISPIRHLSDGFFENQVSKGRLFDVVHQLLKTENKVNYFPAFEFVMDDLRDYRFYAPDLLHPSTQAIQYIWNKFQHTFMDDHTLNMTKKIEKLIQAAQHKPFNSKSEAHQKFIHKTLTEIKKLSIEINANFQNEIELLEKNKV